MTEPDEEDLAERVAELEAALRDLQADLEEEQSRFPRPPSPLDLLRLTDQHAIPAAIAFLEAHIRALELLQGIIRLTGVADPGTSTDPQIERVSRTAIRRLDALVSDLRSTPLPAESESRDILEQAQQLREELADRIDEVDRDDDSDDSSTIDIDVDEELDAIRSDVRGDEEEEEDEEDGEGHSTGENR